MAGDLAYARASGAILCRHVDGHYGQSDIAGDVSVIPAHGARRRKVTMVARSNKVVWSDLSGFVGATPGAADAPNDTAKQKASREAQAKTGKLLPDTDRKSTRLNSSH